MKQTEELASRVGVRATWRDLPECRKCQPESESTDPFIEQAELEDHKPAEVTAVGGSSHQPGARVLGPFPGDGSTDKKP